MVHGLSAVAPASARHIRLDRNRMKDFVASLEKLRKDAAEAALIRDLATQSSKRDLFDQLHRHFSRLADEVEHAIKQARRG
jgi:hypothetical protein